MDSRVLNHLVVTENEDGFSPDEIALSLQELYDRETDAANQQGGPVQHGIIGAVHQTFLQDVPSHFKIILAGSRRTVSAKLPPALRLAGLTVTNKNIISFDLDPSELNFQPASTVTPWESAHQFKVNFDIQIDPSTLERICFRYRVVTAASDATKQRLRAEMMILPAGKTLDGLAPDVTAMVREPAFPGVMVAVITQPIIWFGEDAANPAKQFTTLISQVFVTDPWERQVFLTPDQGYKPGADAFRMPLLNSVLHARLLYDITKLFAQGAAESAAGTPMKLFWKDVEKNQAKIKETEPVLYLAALSCQEEEKEIPFKAGFLWATSFKKFAQARRYVFPQLEDELVSDFEDYDTASMRSGAGSQREREGSNEASPNLQDRALQPVGHSKSVKRKTIKKGNRTSFPEAAVAVATGKFPKKYQIITGPLPTLKKKVNLNFMAGEDGDEAAKRSFHHKEFAVGCLTDGEITAGVKVPVEDRIHHELVPMYFAPGAQQNTQEQQGKKPLFKLPLQMEARIHASLPPSPQIVDNLKSAMPRATEQDIKNIFQDMSMSLSKHSMSSVNSAKKAFTRVFGNEQWLHEPLPSDREILLSRLVRCGTLKRKSALQYMKMYGTILGLNGKKIHPPTATYMRMVAGIKKGLINPILDVATKHRRAHSLPSLRIASAAFAKMRETKVWSAHQAKTCHAVLLLCFWGRFRCGEVLPTTNNNVCILETLLRADVVFVEDKDGSAFIRIWLRKEKGTTTLGGTVVEVPKLPKRLADICPYRALQTYIDSAEKLGLTRFDPLFTQPSGYVVTTAKFSKLVSQSVKSFLPPGSPLFDEIKNHSCRAGVLTTLASYDVHLDEDVAMFLGRWHSSAYKLYQKSFEAALKARRVIEKDLMAKISAGEDHYVNNKKNVST